MPTPAPLIRCVPDGMKAGLGWARPQAQVSVLVVVYRMAPRRSTPLWLLATLPLYAHCWMAPAVAQCQCRKALTSMHRGRRCPLWPIPTPWTMCVRCAFVLQSCTHLTRHRFVVGDLQRGLTPLMVAAIAGRSGLAGLLLRRGADPNIHSSVRLWCSTLTWHQPP